MDDDDLLLATAGLFMCQLFLLWTRQRQREVKRAKRRSWLDRRARKTSVDTLLKDHAKGLRRRVMQKGNTIGCTAEEGDSAVKRWVCSVNANLHPTSSSVETTDETSQPLTGRMDVPVDSEPIDIEPCSATSGSRSQRSGQEQRSKLRKVRSESDESSDGEVQMLAEHTSEERISGAPEPVTSQSLMSIVDINETCD